MKNIMAFPPTIIFLEKLYFYFEALEAMQKQKHGSAFRVFSNFRKIGAFVVFP